jgi:hypothetical protein
VARIAKGDGDAVDDRDRTVVAHRHELPDRPLGLGRV